MLAVANIELPAVPRACDDTTVELPIAKWSALMRTYAINRVKLSIGSTVQRNQSST